MIHIVINNQTYGMDNRYKKLEDRNLIKNFFKLPQGNFNMLAVIRKMEEIGYKFSEDYGLVTFYDAPLIWDIDMENREDVEKLPFIFDMCVDSVNHYTNLTEDQIKN